MYRSVLNFYTRNRQVAGIGFTIRDSAAAGERKASQIPEKMVILLFSTIRFKK